MTYQVRPASQRDHYTLHNFLSAHKYLHRHLDWRDSLDWLGRQPFWLLEENRRLIAALGAPADPPEVAWVRLFGVIPQMAPDKAWQILFSQTLETISTMQPRPVVVSLALRDWFQQLLQRNGFTFYQDIVVFMYDKAPPAPPQLDKSVRLRLMTQQDLPQVEIIDHLSFEPIWRLSAQDLQYAYDKSAYNTVIEVDGEIAGYQMSTSTGFYAHLARLAVRPDLQRRRLGFALVQNLLDYFLTQHACWGVTLNTQHNNTSSIALYHAVGFEETGEKFPVLIYSGNG